MLFWFWFFGVGEALDIQAGTDAECPELSGLFCGALEDNAKKNADGRGFSWEVSGGSLRLPQRFSGAIPVIYLNEGSAVVGQVGQVGQERSSTEVKLWL